MADNITSKITGLLIHRDDKYHAGIKLLSEIIGFHLIVYSNK